jgi:hypothetical protein
MAFLWAFGVAALGMLPMVALTYREYSPFVYIFIALMGLPLIIVLAAMSSVFESYRYKFFAFGIAALLLLYWLRDTVSFDPSLLTPGAVNWNRIIFAQMLYATPIIYVFRERHRIKARWDVRASRE